MYDNYDNIAWALADHEPFLGNSAHAFFDEHGSYQVYSYSTRILTLDFADRVLHFDNRYYSHTTSRLQKLIRDNALPYAGGKYAARELF